MAALAPSLHYSYRMSMRAVYATGVRNFFVLNVPPLERSPHVLGESAQDRQRWIDIASIYNTALLESITLFQTNHPDV